MWRHPLTRLGVATLIALVPLTVALAADEDEATKPAEATKTVAPDRSERFLKRFDLDGDGRVTWEEFQKVRSGFARLDADGDGAIDAQDLAAAKAGRGKAHDGRRSGMRRGMRGPGMRGPGGPGMRGPCGPRMRGPGMRDRDGACDCPCHD